VDLISSRCCRYTVSDGTTVTVSAGRQSTGSVCRSVDSEGCDEAGSEGAGPTGSVDSRGEEIAKKESETQAGQVEDQDDDEPGR
jgi:hypothetical protein